MSHIQLPPDSTGKQLDTLLTAAGQHVETVAAQAADPQTSQTSSVDLAAGASTTLASSAVTAGKTGMLLEAVVSASVPLKVEVEAPAGTLRQVRFTAHTDLTCVVAPPASNIYTAAAGQTFRVTVTNLDTVDAADVYAAFAWDEQ